MLTRALDDLAQPDEQAQVRDRVARLENEIENLVELVAELGDAKTVAGRIREREGELAELRPRIGEDAPPIDRQTLLEDVETAILDFSGTLQAQPKEACAALQKLFGGERLRISPTGEIRGTARLDWLVAGVGFEPPKSRREK